MTKEEVSAALRYLERLRMDSYECETEAEEAALDREYGRIWRSIEPYLKNTNEHHD